MRARAALIILAPVVALAAVPAPASACSCAFETTESKLARADRAVIAKLLEVRVQGEEEFGYAPAVFVYRLRRVFKGPDRLRSRRRIRVHSNNQESACGLPHRRKRYGLFLRRNRSGRLSSGLCSVTSPKAMRRAARQLGAASGRALERPPAARPRARLAAGRARECRGVTDIAAA